jgi:predicted RNase H-like nuclease (RuvC/YqgF family)
MLAAAKENEHPPEVVAQLQSKLADTEAAAKELGEQVNNLQKHLEAVIIEAQAAEELRFQNARQQKEIELLTVKLRDLELAKEEVEQALKDAKPKLESLGNYYGGWNISSLSQTSVEISSMSTTQVSITQIISSGDKDKMRAELLRLVRTCFLCAALFDCLFH